MKTGRIKTMIVIVFVLALGAGVVLGNLVDLRHFLLGAGSGRGGSTAVVGNSPLGEELQLTADQREKMKAIWESVHELTDESLHQSRQALNKRDQDIRILVPQDKIDAYNTINSDYDKTVATLQGRRQKAFEDAVGKTRKMLTSQQCEKYDKILASRVGSEFSGGRDSTGNSSATQPGE